MLLFLFYYITVFYYSQYIKNIGILLFIVNTSENEGKRSSCRKPLLGPLMRISNAKLSIVFTSQLSARFSLGPKQLLSDHWSHLLSFHSSFSFSTWAYRCKLRRWAS